MKKLELVRSYLEDRTIGMIELDETFISTLERPWLRNKVNISCIPEGSYIVKRDKTGRFQWFAVQDVEGRTNIEFHGGLFPKHSKGCILVGIDHDKYWNLYDIDERGLNKLLDYVGEEDFMLTIRAFDVNKDG
jgi:hypothetical protein